MDVTRSGVYTMTRLFSFVLVRILIVAVATLLAGCAVPQPRGNGQLFYKKEPQTRHGYYLYLPDDYAQGVRTNPNRRWPVVVSFHGMKPFDRASSQAKEWQYEADNYGLIVICPELRTADLFMEFPLRRVHPCVKSDEQAILNIMEQVFRTTQADSTRVLATSWSSGGYIAHYMVNRHPSLFTCLAPRQSNFSAQILDSASIPYYQQMPIGIFFGENDIPVCRAESTDAVRWYKQQGFRFVDGRVVIGLGHERTPQTAAAFFARVSKPPILPVRPTLAQESLARLRLVPAEFAGIADLPEPAMSPRTPADELLGTAATAAPVVTYGSSAKTAAQPGRALAAAPPGTPRAGFSPAKAAAPSPQVNTHVLASPLAANPGLPNAIRVVPSTRIGLAPLHISFEVHGPADDLKGAKCTWTDNDEPICTGQTGQRILASPGDHVIGVLVQTRDQRELRAWTTVKVLPPQPSAQ